MLTAGVAVDKATLNFDREFSYIVPSQFHGEIQVGSIVLVPFGRSSALRLGVVLSLEEKDDTKGLKSIKDVKTENWLVTPFAKKMVEHIRETTFCTYYEAAKTVIPYGGQYKITNGLLEAKHKLPTERYYTVNTDAVPEKLTAKQRTVYDYLLSSHKTIKQICEDCGVTKAVVDNLVSKNLLCVSLQDKQPAQVCTQNEKKDISLTEQQQKVFDEITAADNTKPHLIYGVTSSGKTSVFIKLIEDTLKKGKTAMLLVPEISLTPQMINLLTSYFGDVVSVLHSKLSQTERLYQHRKIQQGQSKVIIGTRSAVFAPVDNIGLIIIDEEHEKTFKSENSPRYSAIRVASFIAKEKNAKLVLASATPSIESYHLAQSGFYHLHIMDKRYNDMPMPRVEVIDMRMQAKIGDAGVLSDAVIKYLSDNIRQQKQSIILINRRGYSTVGVCKECRETLQCDNCSVNLVKHKNANKLSCHYCGTSYAVVEKCPVCGGEIQYVGYGTQKVEEYIQSCIPNARILRMDADTTGKNDAHSEMFADFAAKKYDILVGTQMVAKGLDFRDVNLVVVLGMDGALNQVSYNSNETAFNLLTQVIGRAGRWTKDSLAVIQTYDSANPVISLAQKGDYQSFYKNEIAFRQLNIYPPFCTMCQVAFTHEKEIQAARDGAKFLKIIQNLAPNQQGMPLVVLGPAPFSVSMVSGIYRYRLTIKCKNTKKFRDFLRQAIDVYLKDTDNKSAIYVNLNPTQD
ncbi:MAG: primosomal protein N' [Oscillospiraceae bacterium]|nr:primosomal protein N' [Oscillospiraceae bacterium]